MYIRYVYLMSTYEIGSRVRTNRYVGETDHAHTATVEQVEIRDGAPTQYVIRYDEASTGAFMQTMGVSVDLVRRTADALKPA